MVTKAGGYRPPKRIDFCPQGQQVQKPQLTMWLNWQGAANFVWAPQDWVLAGLRCLAGWHHLPNRIQLPPKKQLDPTEIRY